MRRFALPLGLSLVAHAALVALLCYLPQRTPTRNPHALQPTSGHKLALSLAGPQRRRPAPPRRIDPDDWNIDAESPRLIPVPASPIQPVGFSTPESSAGNAPGSGDGPGIGSAPAPLGSSLLPVSARVKRIVYLLDRSISMGPGGGLDRARTELARSLRALPPDSRFQILAYNRAVVPLVRSASGLVVADTPHLAQALNALEELSATGSTDHVAALRQALALRPELLFLLTDADNLQDRDVSTLTRLNQAGSAIHVIEFTRSSVASPTGPLARLAVINQGTYRRVPPRP